jgi:hypothetical protein
MNIIIIGHGPSLKGLKAGEYIDSYEYVVRLKHGARLLGTEDYGSRIDALCCSNEAVGLVGDVQAGMFWLYPKNGNYDKALTFDAVAHKGAPFMIPMDLCNTWNNKFRMLGSSHKNYSTGMAAIIIAAHYYEPESITLAGFDSMLHPDKPFTRNDDIPRTGTGDSRHDWAAENKLLRMVSDTYKFEIREI